MVSVTMMARIIRDMLHERPLAVIVGGYVLFCAVIVRWYLHRVGPDASCYLTIARKYHAWDFTNAINGFWSPLLSWMIAPFLGLGVSAEIVARALEIGIGTCCLAAVWRLGGRLELPRSIRCWTTACLVPAVAMYALTDTTPDLLVAGILVGCLGVMIGVDYPRSPWQGAVCGILGALAYLAKAYAFPFFLAEFLAVSVYWLLRRRADGDAVRRLVLATFTGLLTFTLVAGTWAGLISRKYSRLTIGTTGSYQMSILKGGGGGLFRGGGLFPPANGTAVSAWEDPTDLTEVRQPKPTPRRAHSAGRRAPPARAQSAAAGTAKRDRPSAGAPSPEGAAQQSASFVNSLKNRYGLVIGHVGQNLCRVLWMLMKFSAVTPLILLGLIAASAILSRGEARDRCMILLATLLIYPSGYILIFVVERYLWFMTFVLAVAAGQLAWTLPVLKREPWRTTWAVVAAASFTLWPTLMLARLAMHPLEATPGMAAQLRTTIPAGSRIASDREWGITNAIAFQLDGRYHGMLSPQASTDDNSRQLRDQGIEYLFVWDPTADESLLADAREVPQQVRDAHLLPSQPRVFALPPVGGDDVSPPADWNIP